MTTATISERFDIIQQQIQDLQREFEKIKGNQYAAANGNSSRSVSSLNQFYNKELDAKDFDDEGVSRCKQSCKDKKLERWVFFCDYDLYQSFMVVL